MIVPNTMLTEQQFADMLASYRKSVANKFANPYLFSIIAMMYAYRGKISAFERVLLAGASIGTIIFMVRKQKGDTASAVALNMYEDYKTNILKQMNA